MSDEESVDARSAGETADILRFDRSAIEDTGML